jgi:Tol biopolymer transport system component
MVGSNAGSIIIAPDASAVAFLIQSPTGRKLFVRSLATGETHVVPGVTEASYPFWSPDSKKIGYFGLTKLYTINLAGGLPEAIADIQQGRGGAWTDGGEILSRPSAADRSIV